ncbi:MAG: DEAD/DEAH box helicase, partial [Thermodesulfovibrionales bacterium]|nr:DEAD/DEAH box helicase [Thermodesulfovibrionales bacterium]
DVYKRQKSSSASMRLTMGNTLSGGAGLTALIDFKVSLYIQDDEISVDELRRLIETEEGLAFIKNKWIVVDHERLRQILDAYDKATGLLSNMDLTLLQALRLQLNPQKYLGIEKTEGIEISSGDYLKSVMQRLSNIDTLSEVDLPENLTPILRPYQKAGVKWLYNINSLRFGSCLADDMGLGKTLQVLTLLRILKGLGVNLLIAPLSLLSNWEDEIKKFTPDLKCFIAHPAFNYNKEMDLIDEGFIKNFDLVITTYGFVQKYEWISKFNWHFVILDEAQAIKNPTTKQTKSVKVLKSYNRIAITGTPVENSLYDLWSIFDFINPGLLGSLSEFTDFSKSLKSSPEGFGRLRKIVSPYILRRLKSDKSIISDLPDKIEMKTYASLSKKQALLYQNAVEKLKEEIEDCIDTKRKGLVLTYLMKFKQLCNHPDHYLGKGDYDEAESGKFERLREICETIAQKREKLILFTQFREITLPLHRFLREIFGKTGYVLDGSTAPSKRKKIVSEFQTSPNIAFMVLSIKAGGVGLNLTSANHVIIFDRWWNPAVENQATDRAFRIGQKKNVVVHKFLTKGTIEEKIDSIIESKKQIVNDVIEKTPDESWLTEMSNEELINMFSLSIN